MNIQKLIESYLDMEAYGSNIIIKEYCRFPKCLPLPCHMEHGWTPIPNALVTDLVIASKKNIMLVFSDRRLKFWQKASKVPVYVIGAPFVHYRRMANITPNPKSRGTIVFPSHSTIFLQSQYNIDEYCNKLKNLPMKFHPITICLLYPDIKLGRDKEYRKRGFKVVSAGRKLRGSKKFPFNFYKILANHKYATSNEIGTYTFYSIEFGLPFFLSGDEPTVVNIGDKDPNSHGSGKNSDYALGKKVFDLFNVGTNAVITPEQQQLVKDELGIENHIDPKKLNKILWSNTRNLRYWLKYVPMYCLLTFIKFVIPQNLAYWIIERKNKKPA